jgi:hypothetical protein
MGLEYPGSTGSTLRLCGPMSVASLVGRRGVSRPPSAR